MTTFEQIKKEAKANLKEVIAHRRFFHTHPELGFHEVETAAYIRKELDKLGIKYKTGKPKSDIQYATYGEIKGDHPGKTVLLRADIDALPIKEETGLSFASDSGRMHACGHDAHGSTLLGVLKMFMKMKDQIHGTVRFLFQPAEEGPDLGGGIQCVEQGMTKGIDAAYALHVFAQGDENKVYLSTGPMTAHFVDWKLIVKGQSGHASTPHLTKDPINMGTMIVQAFNSIVSRLTDPTEMLVVTTSMFHGGTANNQIPQTVELEGTVRTYNYQLSDDVKVMMEDIIKGITSMYHADYEFTFLKGYPPCINNAELAQGVIDDFKEKLGDDKVIVMEKGELGAEDFGWISEVVPSVYFKIGIHREGTKWCSHHACDFVYDENVLELTQVTLAEAAINYLNSNKPA